MPHPQADLPTTYLLVRHAQTLWNREQRLAGSSEVALSPEAPRQIALLTRRLVKEPVQAIYSSPLSRCLLTVQELAEVRGLAVQVRPGLLERGLGEWEGKTPDELLPRYPHYHFPESAYTGDYRIPGAETLEHLEQRLRRLLAEIQKERPAATVVLSTHSGVIWTVLHRIVLNPPERFFWPANCSLCRLRSQGHHYLMEDFEELAIG